MTKEVRQLIDHVMAHHATSVCNSDQLYREARRALDSISPPETPPVFKKRHVERCRQCRNAELLRYLTAYAEDVLGLNNAQTCEWVGRHADYIPPDLPFREFMEPDDVPCAAHDPDELEVR